MRTERYVVLGLARVRTPWFSDVARWATSGSAALDFVKTVSIEEVRTRLSSGRPFSALLIDGELPGIDRDLLLAATEHGCATIVVTDGTRRDWVAVGAAATLPSDFAPADLDAVLTDHATPIGRADELPGQVPHGVVAAGFRARTVAVTGAGGTGRSVIAMALAQGLADDVAHSDTVVLADLALHADQGMLHDAGDVIPGLSELVEAHRTGSPSTADVRAMTFDIAVRRYRLLLGLRRHRDWTAMRPGALGAALDSLRQAFTVVIADIDDDFEGEALTGSADVEDRNRLARTALSAADVVVAVGSPGVKGVHSLLRVVRDVASAGVESDRILPVVNRAPRRSTQRREVSRTVAELLAASSPHAAVLSPIFVPDCRHLDESIRDGVRLPTQLVEPVTSAVRSRLEATEQRLPAESQPEPVPIGTLGDWAEEPAAG